MSEALLFGERKAPSDITTLPGIRLQRSYAAIKAVDATLGSEVATIDHAARLNIILLRKLGLKAVSIVGDYSKYPSPLYYALEQVKEYQDLELQLTPDMQDLLLSLKVDLIILCDYCEHEVII